MDWITQDYVKAEAKKGRKQALECTRLHWQQLVKAGLKELEKALYERVSIYNEYCAMCGKYYPLCSRCPLRCHNVWDEAYDKFREWEKNSTRSNWRKWKKAAKAMLAKIDRLYGRLYGSKR